MIEKQRWAKLFNIPMAEKTPEPFPQPTINTQRALCVIEADYPDKLGDCFAALYKAFWEERQTIGKVDVIGPVLAKVLGEAETKKVMDKIGSPEAKKALKDNSDVSMAEGAFGLPWWVATNVKGEKEAFWGFDHLGQVIDHLGLERSEQGLRAML